MFEQIMSEPKQFRIPANEIVENFSRSGGKGGQNVNKLSTKVELRWNVSASLAFNDIEKERIKLALKNRINNDGEFVIFCQEERSQAQNRERAFEKLNEMVEAALVVEKERKPTKPTRSAKERRMDEKTRVARKKQERRRVDW
ncbi:aminoacyl-tRNA hydrolase [Candidatus Falkowbacteria bacterium]|nr:aminoacyl-tRNA hydrolase [Candidatus Falkowbacteria bacterium]